jgi:hypothetical protein
MTLSGPFDDGKRRGRIVSAMWNGRANEESAPVKYSQSPTRLCSLEHDHIHVMLRRSEHAGTVKLVPTTAHLERCSGAERVRPLPRRSTYRTRASAEVADGWREADAVHGEQVAHDVVDREEPLGLCHRFEAPHVALAPARRLVGDRRLLRDAAGMVAECVGGSFTPKFRTWQEVNHSPGSARAEDPESNNASPRV